MRSSIAGFAIALTATLASCGVLNPYACRYETRFVATHGTATAAAIGTIVAEFMNFRDYSDGEPVPRALTWDIQGVDLRATVTSLALIDARNPARVIAPIVVQQTSGRLSGSSFTIPDNDRDRFFALLSSGHAAVLAGAPGVPSLVVPLTVTNLEPWHRPSCD